jgi:predicted dehydrogenase
LIKSLLIGYGYWGKKLFSVLNSDSRYTVEDIVDLNPFEIENSIIKVETNLENALASKNYDLAIIATNPTSHFEITKKVLGFGINCLVEKPITLKLNQLAELFYTANKMNVRLLTDYTYLHTEEFKCIKANIQSVGYPFSYDSTRTNLGIIQNDVNVFWDLAVHDLAIIYSLFPNLVLKKIVAFGQIIGPSRVISDGIVLLKFANNFQAKIRVSWHTPMKSRDIKIFGSEGSISWDDLDKSSGLQFFYNRSETDINRLNNDFMQTDGVIKKIPQTSALENEFDSIYEYLQSDSSKINDDSFNLNSKITAALVAIDKSIMDGGAVINFD